MAINQRGDSADQATDYQLQSTTQSIGDEDAVYGTPTTYGEMENTADIEQLTGEDGMLKAPEEELNPEE